MHQGAPALVVVEFVDIGQPIGEKLRVADPFGVRFHRHMQGVENFQKIFHRNFHLATLPFLYGPLVAAKPLGQLPLRDIRALPGIYQRSCNSSSISCHAAPLLDHRTEWRAVSAMHGGTFCTAKFLRADCLLCTSSCATIPSEISNEMLVYRKNTRFSFFCQFNGVFRRIFSGKDFLAWVLLDYRPVVLGMQASFLPLGHSNIFQKVGDPPCSFTAA